MCKDDDRSDIAAVSTKRVKKQVIVGEQYWHRTTGRVYF